MNSKNLPAIFVMAFFMSMAAAPVAAEDSLDVLLDEGKVTLDLRYRYEGVDDDAFDEDANAHTLRTRLGFQSGVWRGWDFNIEANYVRHLSSDFDAGGGTTPDRGEYPVVADPKGTRLNQAYVNYTGIEDWGFKVGRQRINLDNQRFVGSVAWRQTEQVFDAGTVGWSTEKADFSATYVQWVRRIFGEASSAGKHRQDGTVFLNGGIATPIGKLRGYYYHIDNEDVADFSTGTIGVRLAGKPEINDDWSIRYEAEYAHQSDAGNNPVDYSADYFHLAGAAVIGIFDFGLGWELLGGDDGDDGYAAFRTPLATLHKFNGWADQFLSTPANGLSDLYVTFKATPGDFLFDARFHNFEADAGSDKYGTELDFRAGYKFTKRFRADLFLAMYEGKNSAPIALSDDVTKFWVQLYFKL
ncbi:MAG: hypothetical protein EP301_05490 [Gammaproteobacteria bacterium]|nr:MAG: hypothetical protein EP301_05490 [Gammaproteobacteria bacterium]